MSDNESVLLDLGKDTSSENRGGDIADTFNLFKNYLDSSLTAFKAIFWKDRNYEKLSFKILNSHSKTHAIVCSDASSDAICSFDNENKYFHSNFSKC